MIKKNYRYGLNCMILVLLLISACGPNQTSEGESQRGDSNGADTAVVAETPAKTPTKTPTEQTSNAGDVDASATALREEETGVADLRELVDDIAPLSANRADISEPSASGASTSETKQESSTSNNKTADASTTDIQEPPTVMVALATSGLQTVDVQTGSTLDIVFEVDQDIVISTVSNVFGDPTETVQNSECPAGPLEIITWSNGFSIHTLDETFVGWGVRPSADSEPLTTIAGAGIGTSLRDLQAAYEVNLFESSLGTEFNIGQMSGLLSSDQPDGEITHLWAGANCIFR